MYSIIVTTNAYQENRRIPRGEMARSGRKTQKFYRIPDDNK